MKSFNQMVENEINQRIKRKCIDILGMIPCEKPIRLYDNTYTLAIKGELCEK